MIKFIITVLVLILAIIGGIVVFSDSDSTDVGLEVERPDGGGIDIHLNVDENEGQGSGSDGQVADEESNSDSQTKTFILTGENFRFVENGADNPDIVVAEGDTVRIEFESTLGFHDWVVDEFDAATEQVSAGGTTSVTFIADEAGTFEYYCSVGNHRDQGMRGNLVVE